MTERADIDGVAGSGAVVRKFPTRLNLRCGACGHQGVAEAFLDKPPKLVCTKCGNRNPIIIDRDRMQGWARRRRGR
jgi:hypothetical protein